jgi:hypothetical protein
MHPTNQNSLSNQIQIERRKKRHSLLYVPCVIRSKNLSRSNGQWEYRAYVGFYRPALLATGKNSCFLPYPVRGDGVAPRQRTRWPRW